MEKLMLGLIALLISASVYFYPQLPPKLPLHWNVWGQVDSYGDKYAAIWLMPAITVLMFIGFKFIPLLDPKKDKYKLFKKEWEIIRFGFIAFFSYLQLIIIYAAMNRGANILPLMFIGLGSLFIMLGNYMSKIRQNYFIGIKTPWALADEDNWNKTHRFASWCFVILGIIILAEAYFLWFAPVIIFASIILTAVMPGLYSFLLYKKKTGLMKWIFAALGVLLLGIFMIRLVSGEDGWICERKPASAGGSGEARWVKHGNPDMPAPRATCR